MPDAIDREVEHIYKTESRRALATLIRILGDIDLAEEALHEAFRIALEKWPEEGIPENARAWLISTGKFKGIDSIRRLARGKELLEEKLVPSRGHSEDPYEETGLVEDDQLRLIFICCHPLIPLDSRIALSLRETCGMSTEEIARAYLTSRDTIQKRITRAKVLIKDKQIPYEIPSKEDLSDRMNAVLHVIYLIFNEGYAASSGEHHQRKQLAEQAILLSRELVALMPTPESLGLLALCLLHQSRSRARVTEIGEVIPLEDQDRSQWDQESIREGVQLIQKAVLSGRLGPYTIQAAIASVHALADSVQNTQWDLIVGYYDTLLSIQASPVVELNRAIAVGMHEGPEAGLEILERLRGNDNLASHHMLHSARAELSRRAGLREQAASAYRRAIELVDQAPEQRYLEKRLAEMLK